MRIILNQVGGSLNFDRPNNTRDNLHFIHTVYHIVERLLSPSFSYHQTEIMAQVKQTGGIVPSDIPVVTAVAAPALDIESQVRQEHTSASEEFGDEGAGMGMGATLFVLIFVCLASYIFTYTYTMSHLDKIEAADDDAYLQDFASGAITGLLVTGVSFWTAFVIASIIACGCCCAGKYKLRPHVKKWATGTLGMLSIVFGINMIGRVVTSHTGLGILFTIQSVLLFSALVFSGLFIFGRRCGAPVTSG